MDRMKTKHTPGPWKVVNFDGNVSSEIRAENGVMVGNPYGPAGRWAEVREEHEANANLIAAAPDLLEACKEAYRIIHNDAYVNDLLKKAIAKAEGKE